MTIYEFEIFSEPDQRWGAKTIYIAEWLSEMSERGLEFVSTTYIDGVVKYVFRRPVTKQ